MSERKGSGGQGSKKSGSLGKQLLNLFGKKSGSSSSKSGKRVEDQQATSLPQVESAASRCPEQEQGEAGTSVPHTYLTPRMRVRQDFEHFRFQMPRELPQHSPSNEEEKDESDPEEEPEENTPSGGETPKEGNDSEEEESEEEGVQAPVRIRSSSAPRPVAPQQDESEPMDVEGHAPMDNRVHIEQHFRPPYSQQQQQPPTYLHPHASSSQYPPPTAEYGPMYYPPYTTGSYSTVYGSPPPGYMQPSYGYPYPYPYPYYSYGPSYDPYHQHPFYGGSTSTAMPAPRYPSLHDRDREMLDALVHSAESLAQIRDELTQRPAAHQRSRTPSRQRPQPEHSRQSTSDRQIRTRDHRRT